MAWYSDPIVCGNCGQPAMGEPHQLGPHWMQTCTNCGRSKEIPTTHPFVQEVKQMQPQYPALLNEVGPARPLWGYKQISHRTAKFESINSLDDLKPWQPGQYGKGMVLRDGSVLTWNNPDIHHYEVRYHLPSYQNPQHLIDWIKPDGSVYSPGFERFFPQMEAAGLRPSGDWDFSMYDD